MKYSPEQDWPDFGFGCLYDLSSDPIPIGNQSYSKLVSGDGAVFTQRPKPHEH